VGAPGQQILEVPVAEAGLAYTVARLEASPGVITLRSVNPQAASHNIALELNPPVIGPIVGQGGVSEITVTIDAPGEYIFYCSIPGHRDAGMAGVLYVS
jgi:plastocyanin